MTKIKDINLNYLQNLKLKLQIGICKEELGTECLKLEQEIINIKRWLQEKSGLNVLRTLKTKMIIVLIKAYCFLIHKKKNPEKISILTIGRLYTLNFSKRNFIFWKNSKYASEYSWIYTNWRYQNEKAYIKHKNLQFFILITIWEMVEKGLSSNWGLGTEIFSEDLEVTCTQPVSRPKGSSKKKIILYEGSSFSVGTKVKIIHWTKNTAIESGEVAQFL